MRDLGELLGGRQVVAVEALGALDLDALKPVERGALLARPNRDDGLDPGRVQKGVAQVVAVELQQPAQ